jgi:GPH family glycoside/pentoside/hexuronide:cation symporter
MIADIVEDSQKKTGRRSEGLFFAGQTFASKVVHGFGMFATGIILSMIRFPQEARPGEVPPEVLLKLAIIYVPLIVIFYAGAVICLTRYRITRQSHAQNLEILESKTISSTKT